MGIKFCGHCNPEIPTGDIYQRCKREIESKSWLKFVSPDTPEIDILVVISGCPVDCAERPKKIRQEIAVAGESIDRKACANQEIPLKIIEKLEKINNKA